MPTKAYPLGEWLPDNPGGLQVANNVRAIANGYAPIGAPQAVTVALGDTFQGGAAFVGSDGSSTLLVAARTNVYKYTGSSWTSVVVVNHSKPVRFAQYGDEVILTSDTQLCHYNLLTGTSGFIGTSPNAIDVAQTRDFVTSITTDNALQWCQFNNSLTWTTGVNQADKQPSLWGRLMRVVGGEYMIAITDRSVVRGSYVGVEGGLDIIWQFDEISQEVGCMASGSVCNVGRLVFFLSERGFMMCDGQTVEPIADEKFNRWFFGQFSRADIANIWSAIDPRNSLVLWAMPGTPGTVIAYNWVLKKATTFQINVSAIFTGYTAGTPLDALDATFGNLDAMTISLDDPSLQGGNPILLFANSENVLTTLTGDNLEATFMLQNIEPTPGARSRIREIRLVSDATQGAIQVDARLRAGDAESTVSAASMRLNGKFPIRTNGRYNNITVTLPAGSGWSFVQGLEVEFEPSGER